MMRQTSALFFLVCVALLAFAGTYSLAENTGRDLVVEALEQEHGGPLYRSSWALVVGVNRYVPGGPLRRLS